VDARTENRGREREVVKKGEVRDWLASLVEEDN